MMDFEKITFSSNFAIDASIKEMMPSFSEVSQKRMQKAILDAKRSAEKHRDENTDANARHIFREFIPAHRLNQNGFDLEYEKSIQGKKPDWLDEKAGLLIESYTYERGGSSTFWDRLSTVVASKCNKYKSIITANSFGFVIAVYLDFLTGISPEECGEELEMFCSLFDQNDILEAIIFFSEDWCTREKQEYKFYCISKASFLKAFPNWPFETASI